MDTGPRTFIPMFAVGNDIRANVIYDETFTFTRSSFLTFRCMEGRSSNPLTETTGPVVFSVADRAVESDGPLVLRFFNNRNEIAFVLR